jgi:hypothetical protein
MIDVICGSDGRFIVKLYGHTLDRFNDKRGVREARKLIRGRPFLGGRISAPAPARRRF